MSNKEIEIPEAFQEWVSQWLFKHVESAPIDLDEHVRVTTFCRAIVYQAYRHLCLSSKPETGLRWVKADLSQNWKDRTGNVVVKTSEFKIKYDVTDPATIIYWLQQGEEIYFLQEDEVTDKNNINAK